MKAQVAALVRTRRRRGSLLARSLWAVLEAQRVLALASKSLQSGPRRYRAPTQSAEGCCSSDASSRAVAPFARTSALALLGCRSPRARPGRVACSASGKASIALAPDFAEN